MWILTITLNPIVPFTANIAQCVTTFIDVIKVPCWEHFYISMSFVGVNFSRAKKSPNLTSRIGKIFL